MSVPGSGKLGDACRWLSRRDGISISLQAGAGWIVSGRPASELTLGEVFSEDGLSGSGEGVDEGYVCTEVDVGTRGGVDGRCCWLAQQGLCLGWDYG